RVLLERDPVPLDHLAYLGELVDEEDDPAVGRRREPPEQLREHGEELTPVPALELRRGEKLIRNGPEVLDLPTDPERGEPLVDRLDDRVDDVAVTDLIAPHPLEVDPHEEHLLLQSRVLPELFQQALLDQGRLAHALEAEDGGVRARPERVQELAQLV